MSELSRLYHTDYSTWATRHAELLRAGRYAELDMEHLLEELSDMSRSERRELESRLWILLALHSSNLVARFNLPNMAYAPEDKLRVYAQAIRGLVTLEPRPEQRLK